MRFLFIISVVYGCSLFSSERPQKLLFHKAYVRNSLTVAREMRVVQRLMEEKYERSFSSIDDTIRGVALSRLTYEDAQEALRRLEELKERLQNNGDVGEQNRFNEIYST